jgi:hypothetical protein
LCDLRNTQSVENVAQMMFYSTFTDLEVFGDFLIGITRDYFRNDFELSRS